MADNGQILDRIDDFLQGKLDANELKEFQKQFNSDEKLRKEVEFQKMIKDGLIEVRKLELKNRLNNIAIESNFNWLNVGIAASIAFVGLLSYGIYSKQASESKPVIVETKSIEIKKEADPTLSKEKDSKVNQTTFNAEIEKDITVKSTKRYKKAVIEVSKPEPNIELEEETLSVNDVNAPVPHDISVHHVDKHDHGVSPNGKIEQVGAVNISSLKVNTEKNKDKFHYKYFDDKLVLAGDFSKGPYELIELNKNQEKKLYLYYDGSFYELHYGKSNFENLVEINQTRLIKELKNKIKK